MQLIEHLRELMTVFRIVNALCRCAKDVDPVFIQAGGKVVRNLTACRQNHAMRSFKINNIHNPLVSQLVKVKTVAHIVVCRHRFRVIVYHHRAVAFLTDGVECLHAAPVEFDRGTDAVGSGAEHDDGTLVVLEGDVVSHAAVGEVEVVGLCGIFGSEGVNLLHIGHNACHLTACADGHLCLLHLHFLFQSDGACHLEIGESLTLSLRQEFVVEDIDVADALQFLVGEVQIIELLEEPSVNLCQFVDLVDGISLIEGLFDDEDTLVGWCL